MPTLNRLVLVAAVALAGCSGGTAATTGSLFDGAATSAGATAGSTTGATAGRTTGTNAATTTATTTTATTGHSASSTSGDATTAGPTTTGPGHTSASSSSSSGHGTTTGAASTSSGTSGTTGSSCKSGTATKTELQACGSDSDCTCGQSCVADPAFAVNDTTTACETVCTSNADCPNVTSICTGTLGPGGASTCAVNLCGQSAEAGSACDATALGAQDGTCVPQDSVSGADFAICMPNGTATTCSQKSDDCPWATTNEDSSGDTSLYVESPQPRTLSLYCPAGMGCLQVGSASAASCVQLCDPEASANSCSSGVCLLPDSADTEFGYCGACHAKNQPCNADGDCCSMSCDYANDSVCD